ncbi:MAG: sortase [Candidatus Saccharimonadales bacterium]
MKDKNWRRANLALLLLIILLNSYIITLPFLPNVVFWWHSRSSSAEKTLTSRILEPKKTAPDSSGTITKPSEAPTFHADSTHDGLIIPKMLLETPLVEGPMHDSFNLLNQGAWRLPIANSPDKGGNTVIAGHRFSYTGPRGIFYFLNKLAPGDLIGLWYHGKLYQYTVSTTRTVAASEVSVQEPTLDTRLTLYTCTPLFNPVNRLVVVATPSSSEAKL